MSNKNPSLWHIGTKRIAGKKFYNVYRNLDEDLCDTEDNRDYRGGLYDRLYDAEALARRLNTEEAVKK